MLVFGLVAGFVLAGQAAGAQTTAVGAVKKTTLEARLKQLEDAEEIRHLLADYIRFVDAGDYLRYSQLFARDGELIFAQNRLKGPDAIRKLMEEGARTATPDRTAAMKGSGHLLTDVSIDVSTPGGDEATASARWTLVARGGDIRPVVNAYGHYSDVLTRENGRWRFKKRVVYADNPHQDPFETN